MTTGPQPIEAADLAAEITDLLYDDTDHRRNKDLDVIYPSVAGITAVQVITPSGMFLVTVSLIDPHRTIGPDYW